MDFQAIKNQINELKVQAQKQAQEFFNQGCQELFRNNPDLESFSWRQYTPYFNDGDPCVFSAQNDDPYVNNINEWGDTEDGEEGPEVYNWNGRDREYTDYGVKWLAMAGPVKEFLATFEDDDLLNLFGDHVTITVTKDGIQKEEYDHD